MKKYIRIMRLDHWIKQLFIIPGCVSALFLLNKQISADFWRLFALGYFSVSLIASANYVINEWLDAEFDKYHPTKKNRSVVTEDVNGTIVLVIWIALTVLGLSIANIVNIPFFLMCVWLWVMGILYNVKPFRTKDIAYLDVLTESINNAIRLLMGWFIVSNETLPPSSLIFGYWMTGAFLMAIKRFAEYRMINDKTVAENYRKSFKYYTEKTLLLSAFFYAMTSTFFIGIFLIKYKVELLLLMPVLIGLFCLYFNLSFEEDSSVQKPEKLYRNKKLMIYCIFTVVVFIILMNVDIPFLNIFTNNKIINI